MTFNKQREREREKERDRARDDSARDCQSRGVAFSARRAAETGEIYENCARARVQMRFPHAIRARIPGIFYGGRKSYRISLTEVGWSR